MNLYDKQEQHFSPKFKIRQPQTKGLIKGKFALRAWWKDCFDRLPSLRYPIKSLIAENGKVFMEYNRVIDNEKDVEVGEVLEMEYGEIIFSRVYHG
ncbi:nuclear transport factor 2 family protein [Chryseobacterium sp.]|uniref:nuclear transport factor 2 family protein n=1 Tax=Chryseobacterium sp. TaxID=1871047 RepID=UPI0038910DC3